MEQLAETDLQIEDHPGPEAVILDAISHRPDFSNCEGSLGDLLLHTVLTLEAHCSTLVVEPSFLHHLSSKQFDSADHKMANFVALARSDDVHFLIESKTGCPSPFWQSKVVGTDKQIWIQVEMYEGVAL